MPGASVSLFRHHAERRGRSENARGPADLHAFASVPVASLINHSSVCGGGAGQGAACRLPDGSVFDRRRHNRGLCRGVGRRRLRRAAPTSLAGGGHENAWVIVPAGAAAWIIS